MPGNIEEVTAQLTKLVRAKTGDAGARAHSLETLPGHAGFSYSFILERSTDSAPRTTQNECWTPVSLAASTASPSPAAPRKLLCSQTECGSR